MERGYISTDNLATIGLCCAKNADCPSSKCNTLIVRPDVALPDFLTGDGMAMGLGKSSDAEAGGELSLLIVRMGKDFVSKQNGASIFLDLRVGAGMTEAGRLENIGAGLWLCYNPSHPFRL